MTFHSRSDWNFGESIREEDVVQAANAIKHHNYRNPLAFAILSQVDNFILGIGIFLNQYEGTITKQIVKEHVNDDDCQNEIEDQVIEFFCKVLEELKLMGQIWPKLK